MHPKAFLAGWAGKLVCDDYSGYKALFSAGVTEVGCLAHARRKFHDLWVNHHSAVAEETLKLFGLLYDVEREAREVSAEQRRRTRQLQSRPIADKLREWLLLQRQKATDGTAIAKAITVEMFSSMGICSGATPPERSMKSRTSRPTSPEFGTDKAADRPFR
jgi:transposase